MEWMMSYHGRNNCSRSPGFTLIELMVTLSVIAIFSTLGVPALASFIRTMQQSASFAQLANTYAFARQEAVHRQVNVSICPVSQRLPDQCSENWSCGMLVYIDRDGDKTFNHATDTKLRQLYFSDGVAIKLGKNRLIKRLTLKPEGTVSANSFTVSVPGLAVNKKLVFTWLGRARVDEVDVLKDKGRIATKCPP